MLKLVVKFSEAISAHYEVAKEIESAQGGAIVCHKIEEEKEKEEAEKKKKDTAAPKKKKKEEEDAGSSSDDDDDDVTTIVVEVLPAHVRVWTASAAAKANADAVQRAVGDIPHGDVANLSSSEKMDLLQQHVTDVVYDVIRHHCGEVHHHHQYHKQQQHQHGGEETKTETSAADADYEHGFGAKGRRSTEEQKRYAKLCDTVEVIPVHDDEELAKIFSLYSFPSVDALQSYFGLGGATYYFAWVSFYNRALLVPAVLGSLIFAYNYAAGMTVNTNPIVAPFSLFVVFWAIIFSKGWSRESNAIAAKYHCTYSAEVEHVRPSFKGKYVLNEITGEHEKMFPTVERMKRQAVAWSVTVAMLGVALVVQIGSLNLQGYMRGKHNEFEIEFLADLAEPGAVFDPDSMIGMVPIVGHSVIIMILNEIYKSVADKLTTFENWRTKSEHENSLIMKRLVFEFFDIYAVLFYVAFYRLDLLQLRMELVSMFSVDQVRRVVTETLIPLITKTFFSVKDKRLKEISKKKQAEKKNEDLVYEIENSLMEYEGEYDNLMELLLGQFGLVTLFAAGMPLAAMASLLSNLVEMRSDLYKLAYLTRRPSILKQRGIAPWDTVQKLFVYAAALTNVILFGFTSDQINIFFPQFFDTATLEPLPGYGRAAVSVVFILEHIVLLLVLAFDTYVPDTDDTTSMVLRARQIKYVRDVHLKIAPARTKIGGGEGKKDK